MDANQLPTEVLDVSVEQSKPDTKKCEVLTVALLQETPALAIPNTPGIILIKSPLLKLKRSKTEISIKTEVKSQPDLIEVNPITIDADDLSQKPLDNVSKPSKIRAPTPKMFSNRIKTTDVKHLMTSRKKSKSDVGMQLNETKCRPESKKIVSTTSRMTTPSAKLKCWSISTAPVPLPTERIHKPGTLPAYLRTQRKQKPTTDGEQNKCVPLACKNEGLGKIKKTFNKFGKAKENVSSSVVVLEGEATEAMEKVAQMPKEDPDVLSKALKLSNYNVLRYVESEMNKLNDSYVHICQQIFNTHFAKDCAEEKPENLEAFRNYVNNLEPNLKENFAQIKIDRNAAIAKCLTEVKHLMITRTVQGDTSESIQDLLNTTNRQHAQQIQQLNGQIEKLRSQVLSTKQKNNVLEKTNADYEANREILLKAAIAKREDEISKWTDKCKRLEIQREENECKIGALTTKIDHSDGQIKRYVTDLKAANEQLNQSLQQCEHLRDQVAVLTKRHDESLSEYESKLLEEREEKQKIQSILKQSKEIIEPLCQQPVELSEIGIGGLSCGDVSDAVPDIEFRRSVLHQTKSNMFAMPLPSSDWIGQQNNTIVQQLECQLQEKTNRLSETEASMQAKILQLKQDNEKSQGEMMTMRAQLSEAGKELREKDKTINVNQRLLRTRNELIDLMQSKSPEASKYSCMSHDKWDSELCNLSAKQQLIVQRLEEHHARSARNRVQQIERFKQLEAENAMLRCQLMPSKGLRVSTENIPNHIDCTMENVDRKEMFLNCRRQKRKCQVINKNK